MSQLINKSGLKHFTRRQFNKVMGSCFLGTAASLAGFPGRQASADELYVSEIFVNGCGFLTSIEGPACDRDGNLYAVSYKHKSNIGMVTPDGECSLFVELPDGSYGNGIRFDSEGSMMIADYINHNILKVNMETREISVHAHEPSMNQPNDIAITENDTVYASDPNWGKSTGNIWRIDTDGTAVLLESGVGTTNGIEVSPDEKRLYYNESVQRNVWACDLSPEGEIISKNKLISFTGYGMDGMRCDVDGNLYITRQQKGTIAKVSPEGDLLLEIVLTGKKPSNIAFGGTDGRTCYVTMMDNGSIETFRVEKSGRSWQMYQNTTPAYVSETKGKPQNFKITGNYPNPFNAGTTIEFTTPDHENVQLDIYSISGQKVITLISRNIPAGNHRVMWNGTSAAGHKVSSGMYIVYLKSGSTGVSHRMTFMK